MVAAERTCHDLKLASLTGRRNSHAKLLRLRHRTSCRWYRLPGLTKTLRTARGNQSYTGYISANQRVRATMRENKYRERGRQTQQKVSRVWCVIVSFALSFRRVARSGTVLTGMLCTGSESST